METTEALYKTTQLVEIGQAISNLKTREYANIHAYQSL